jgi:hypothetical protein
MQFTLTSAFAGSVIKVRKARGQEDIYDFDTWQGVVYAVGSLIVPSREAFQKGTCN